MKIHDQSILLRQFTDEDIPAVAKLANEKYLAEMTQTVPHPYSEVQAKEWIQGQPAYRQQGRGYPMAITLKKTTELIGAVEIGQFKAGAKDTGEIGFWIGEPYRGHGYAAQAGKAMLDLNQEYGWYKKVIGYCLALNPASARTLEKLGFKKQADPFNKVGNIYFEKDHA